MKKKDKKDVILIVDDEEAIRDSMKMLLSDTYDVAFAKNGREAVEKMKKINPDLMLLDIRLPEIDGLEVLKIVKKENPDLEVIMVTALNTVKNAVEAMKSGAYDYITKPFDIESISSLIEKVLEKRSLRNENLFLRQELDKKYQFEKIVGAGHAMREIFSLITDVAKNDSTVLIQGESGTGKELVARAIHNLGDRKNKLFVPVNCAAIPENLLESELFGHERGAFTGAFERKLGKFELAEGGTLFLDEIGSMPLSLQSKLLRVLQEKEIERVGGTHAIPINVRVISATNSDLAKALKEEKFRKDLYYRLNVIPIVIPPLRARKEDIPLLVDHFITIYNAEFGKKVATFSREAEEALMDYSWPGNVRELQNLIERLVALSKGKVIYIERLPKEITDEEFKEKVFDENDLSFKKSFARFEAAFLKRALERTGGRKGRAAAIMGVHRNTVLNMHRRLKRRRA